MKLKGTISLQNLNLSLNQLEAVLRTVVMEAVRNSLGAVRSRVGFLLNDHLTASPEWQSMFGGMLQQEFGLANPAEPLGKIKDALVHSIEVSTVSPSGGTLGGMLVTILPKTLEHQLATSLAYQSLRGKVDWLSWLLFSGSAVVVSNARFISYRRSIEGSRAGFGLMVRSAPLGYSVSPEFQGTESSNWFDRVLEGMGNEVLLVMADEVQRRFR